MTYKPVQWEANGTSYTVKAVYVDIETGEIINRKDALNKYKYIIIKKTKENEYNQSRSKCTIKYTNQCKRNPQTRLELS